MLDGIPYWGSNTFKDMRKLEKCKIKKVDYNGSLEGLITELFENNSIIQIKDNDIYYYTYIRDIVFNYRDGLILLPYYKYQEYSIDLNVNNNLLDYKHLDINNETINLRYAFNKNYVIIDDYKLDARISDLRVVSNDKKSILLYSLNMKYTDRLTFSLDTLIDYYIDSCYYNKLEDIKTDNLYHKIDKESGNNIEYKLRKKYMLPHYIYSDVDYTLLDYKDVRTYKLSDYINNNGVISNLNYSYRRFLFESYIYFSFASDLTVLESEYAEKHEALGKTLKYYKYNKGSFYIILKHYYKKFTVYSKMTYEKYRVV